VNRSHRVDVKADPSSLTLLGMTVAFHHKPPARETRSQRGEAVKRLQRAGGKAEPRRFGLLGVTAGVTTRRETLSQRGGEGN
jgi:hypothetical protein